MTKTTKTTKTKTTTTKTSAALLTKTVDSPVGSLHAFASAAGLRALLWSAPSASDDELSAAQEVDDDPVLDAVAVQLAEYFRGERRAFDVPLDPVGTPFQREAWAALRTIPYGCTRSYAEQAAAIGRPRAVRAIGAANGRNPISIIVPCHRVIGSDGSLTGFAGGLDVKRFLLELESSQGELLL